RVARALDAAGGRADRRTVVRRTRAGKPVAHALELRESSRIPGAGRQPMERVVDLREALRAAAEELDLQVMEILVPAVHANRDILASRPGRAAPPRRCGCRGHVGARRRRAEGLSAYEGGC